MRVRVWSVTWSGLGLANPNPRVGVRVRIRVRVRVRVRVDELERHHDVVDLVLERA